MKVYHICYHTDEDGTASAAVIYEYLKVLHKRENLGKPVCFFHRIDYTVNIREILNDVHEQDEVYFVDYSFSNINNFKAVLELAHKGNNIVWIDHHITSVEIIEKYKYELNGLTNFCRYINVERCAAWLAYNYAYCVLNDYPLVVLNSDFYFIDYPLYIKYVDSWDTWKHNMSNTIEFNLGMQSIKHTPKNTFSLIFNCNSRLLNKLFVEHDRDEVNKHMRRFIDDVISKGKVIKSYDDINNDYLCNEFGFECAISDNTDNWHKLYSAFAVNRRGSSTMFGDRINKYDIVIAYAFNGEVFVYSFFTNKDNVDCKHIAELIGEACGLSGGGYKQAAGCTSKNNLFSNNCIVHIKNKLFGKRKHKLTIY